MSEFNQAGRIKNSLKASSFGIINQVSKILMNFIFRTVFLYILTKEFLGIEGLFTNILSFLSLAELGIGTAIVFRMYEPIRSDNVNQLNALMHFYKIIYRYIALIIFLLGIAIMPALPYLIKDISELPESINLYFIYSLFLFQSVTSYFFVYKQSIITADQKNHLISVFNVVLNIVKFGGQILVLVLTKNYSITLASGIILQIACNFIFSLLITRRYSQIFRQHNRLNREEKKLIFKDTGALVCHRLGSSVVNATDNILLSSFIGIGVLGIYSNYSLIIVSVLGILAQIFQSFVSSIGNLCVEGNIEKQRQVYFKLDYLNLWASSVCTLCMFVLLNPFMTIWQNAGMTLSQNVVFVLSISFFITSSRKINLAFIDACGLFNRDRVRPLIEAALNLMLSIILVKTIGIAGIFLGTIGSSIFTVWWREPYLLHKHFLKLSMKKYWLTYAYFVVLTILAGALTFFLCSLLTDTIWFFVIKVLLCLFISNFILIVGTFWFPQFHYYRDLIKGLLKKKKSNL